VGKIRWYWTTEEDEEFKKDWASGVLGRVMAEKFKVNQSTISNHARDLGLKARSKRRKRRKKR
jgi:hypothetical protein